ncbi:DUF397 domain-containing protein [Streptomyces sp. NPDC002851]
MSTRAWQKSSYCGQGESCIHVAKGPQKSTYCQEGDACVHVDATTNGTVLLTESSDPTGAVLTTDPATFATLLAHLKGTGDSPGIDITHAPTGQVVLDGTVTTTEDKWHAFTLGARAGEFDHFAAD